MLGLQFVSSAIIISLNVFQLSTQKMNLMETTYSILFFIALVYELFVFCIPADKVKEKVKPFNLIDAIVNLILYNPN